MSYTARPSLARTTGAANRSPNTRQISPHRSPERSAQGQALHTKPEQKQGYSIIPPNETKRQKTERIAKQEEKSYNEYRENHRLGYVSYVGTAGGGLVTEDSVRARQQNKLKNTTTSSFEKSQQYKQMQKMKENEEIEKKKREQRQKAESNAAADQHRQENYREDHRMKNAAFLNGLEKKRAAGSSSVIRSSNQISSG